MNLSSQYEDEPEEEVPDEVPELVEVGGVYEVEEGVPELAVDVIVVVGVLAPEAVLDVIVDPPERIRLPFE